jgi:hypothetical protein
MTGPALHDEIHRVFGPAALEWGLFYVHEPALRFELSGGGGYIEMFTRAYDRAREIVAAAFADTAELTIVLAHTCGGGPAERSLALSSIRHCGIRIPRPYATWTEDADEDGFARVFLAFRAGREMVDRLLWGALATEMAIHPSLACRVYLADVERGVLAFPYDDRGMDVIGPNHALLGDLYTRFNPWLLDYDRERMDGFFAGS